MRFLLVLLILFPPFILYIGMQPQLNEIEQWMIGVSLFLLCILAVKDRIPDIRQNIAEYKEQKKDYPPNKQSRRVGGIFLVFVVGMTILGVLLTNYISQSI